EESPRGADSITGPEEPETVWESESMVTFAAGPAGAFMTFELEPADTFDPAGWAPPGTLESDFSFFFSGQGMMPVHSPMPAAKINTSTETSVRYEWSVMSQRTKPGQVSSLSPVFFVAPRFDFAMSKLLWRRGPPYCTHRVQRFGVA